MNQIFRVKIGHALKHLRSEWSLDQRLPLVQHMQFVSPGNYRILLPGLVFHPPEIP